MRMPNDPDEWAPAINVRWRSWSNDRASLFTTPHETMQWSRRARTSEVAVSPVRY